MNGEGDAAVEGTGLPGRIGPWGDVVVGAYPNRKALHERALVVLATVGRCRTEEDGGEFFLAVPGRDADRAARELEAYEREALHWPPPEPRLRDESPNLWMGLLFAVVVMGAFLLQGRYGVEFENALLADARMMIFGGQVWRAFTALLLHADLRHLAGNIAAMLLYILLLSRAFPATLCWALSILAGVLGNLSTALLLLLFGSEHRALGASTAVFGALGLLVAVAVRSGFYKSFGPGRRGWIIPLGGGLAILGLTGAGGPQTDVTAHATGFGWGLLLGIAAARNLGGEEGGDGPKTSSGGSPKFSKIIH